jgi:hypothetical protein
MWSKALLPEHDGQSLSRASEAVPVFRRRTSWLSPTDSPGLARQRCPWEPAHPMTRREACSYVMAFEVACETSDSPAIAHAPRDITAATRTNVARGAYRSFLSSPPCIVSMMQERNAWFPSRWRLRIILCASGFSRSGCRSSKQGGHSFYSCRGPDHPRMTKPAGHGEQG